MTLISTADSWNANVRSRGEEEALSGRTTDADDYFEILEDSLTSSKDEEYEPPCPRLATGKRVFLVRKTTDAQKRAHAADQSPEANKYTNRFDYLKKYPEDEAEQAMGPDARVWRVYLDEAAQFDVDMIESFKDTVDAILFFAGLFSAVVTTFVVQASSALRLDYAQVMTSVLLEQLAVQRAFISGSPIPDPQLPALSPNFSTTTRLDRWTNGLWFTSLSFSFATALIAVLVKQWIQAYVSPVSAGSPQIQARIRQYRYMGLQKWHVPLIVGLLPTLLHLSLLLFLLGLVLFLVPLDYAIAGVSAFIATLVYIIYVMTNLAPVFDPQCPYKTPISTYSFKFLRPYISSIDLNQPQYASFLQRLHRMFWWLYRFLIQLFDKISKRHPNPQAHGSIPRDSAADSLKGAELGFIESQGVEIDAYALCWVLKWSSNSSVTAIVLEAAGDLPLDFDPKAKQILMDEGVGHAACSMLKTCAVAHDFARSRPGFERMHHKSALVHFHFASQKICEWLGKYPGCNSPIDPRCTCMATYGFRPSFSDDQDIGDDSSDPYFSLFLNPSRTSINPTYIARCTPPRFPRIVVLHLLRRAVLYLRINPSLVSQRSDIDWQSCRKLLSTVQLDPFDKTDLFSLWRSTFTPIYLLSFLHHDAPILENSTLALKLSFNQIEVGTQALPLDAARARLLVECCIEILIAMLQAEGKTTSLEASGWSEIRAFTEELAHCFSGRYCGSIAWEVTDAGPRCTLLDALLSYSEHCDHSIIELRMLIYSLSCHLWEGGQGLASRPGVIPPLPYQRLIRATLVEPLVNNQGNSDGAFSLMYSRVSRIE